MSILVVDDSRDMHIQLKVFLHAEGINNIHFVDSAAAAFKTIGLSHEKANIPIDLILMDINMEKTNGIDATRKIKEQQDFLDIPILMITGETDSNSLSAAFAAGAVDYIKKPINRIELVARVRSFLKLKAETDARKAREKELEKALSEINILKGILPICASCKKIRKDDGYWQQIENYLSANSNFIFSEIIFSHTICPECHKKLYPGVDSFRD